MSHTLDELRFCSYTSLSSLLLCQLVHQYFSLSQSSNRWNYLHAEIFHLNMGPLVDGISFASCMYDMYNTSSKRAYSVTAALNSITLHVPPSRGTGRLMPYRYMLLVRARRHKLFEIMYCIVHTYFAAWHHSQSMQRGLHTYEVFLVEIAPHPGDGRRLHTGFELWNSNRIYTLQQASIQQGHPPLPRSWSLLRASASDRRTNMKRATIHHTASLNGGFD